MSQNPKNPDSKIEFPARPLPKNYLEPILFLADRMSSSDGNVAPPEERMIEVLAKAAGNPDFRENSSYRAYSDQKACGILDIEQAKNAALVVISLILKADFKRDDLEVEYYRKVRELLGSDPVTVPRDIEEHKKLALAYFSM